MLRTLCKNKKERKMTTSFGFVFDMSVLHTTCLLSIHLFFVLNTTFISIEYKIFPFRLLSKVHQAFLSSDKTLIQQSAHACWLQLDIECQGKMAPLYWRTIRDRGTVFLSILALLCYCYIFMSQQCLYDFVLTIKYSKSITSYLGMCR